MPNFVRINKVTKQNFEPSKKWQLAPHKWTELIHSSRNKPFLRPEDASPLFKKNK